jgi:hypothetical protein
VTSWEVLVLHPPPFFAWLRGEGGREPRRASHAAPGSPGSVVNTAGGRKRRRTEVVSTLLYAAPPVAAELAPFSPSSSFSLFLFPPCFVFPFASGREELLGGPSCGMRHRPEKSQIHRAPCSTAGEKRADAGFRFECS